MNKLNELINWFENEDKVIIALSGGVDSALVAYAAFQMLGKSAIAVTADYKTLSQEELNTAKKVCREIGISHQIIEYNELENEDFVRNDKNRCFHCRNELAHHLNNFAKEIQADVIVDGTNLDDLNDYRPGVNAMKDNGIRSPLVETKFSKKDVRDGAKIVGLSIFDKPSNSCLASRIPWGQSVTQERLLRIEISEQFLKKILYVNHIRVRDLDGIAKIELLQNDLDLLKNKKTFHTICSKLKQFGFTSVVVDPEGYRPGKINVIAD